MGLLILGNVNRYNLTNLWLKVIFSYDRAVSCLGQPGVDHLSTWAQNVVRELTV